MTLHTQIKTLYERQTPSVLCYASGGLYCLMAPPLRENSKRFASISMRSLPAGYLLMSADNDVNVERVELDTATTAAGLLGRDQCRSGSKKRIEHHIAPVGQVEDRVLQQSHWFDRGCSFSPLRASDPMLEAPG